MDILFFETICLILLKIFYMLSNKVKEKIDNILHKYLTRMEDKGSVPISWNGDSNLLHVSNELWEEIPESDKKIIYRHLEESNWKRVGAFID